MKCLIKALDIGWAMAQSCIFLKDIWLTDSPLLHLSTSLVPPADADLSIQDYRTIAQDGNWEKQEDGLPDCVKDKLRGTWISGTADSVEWKLSRKGSCRSRSKMEDEIKNLINVWILIALSLCYSYFLSSKIPKGKFRLLSLLPIFSLFAVLPLGLTYAFPTALTAFFITWLANFKLLLFSFDLGPLSPPTMSLPLFIATACLPIRTKQPHHHNHSQPPPSQEKPPKTKKSSLNLAAETAVLSFLMGAVHHHRDVLHPKIVLTLYCLLVFLMVEVILSLANAAAGALMAVELEPPSDEPYLATSLQDFWGKRWNLLVSNTLRHTVYKPVRSVSAAHIGRRWAALTAVMASFVVSGLMHELLFYYVTRVSPTWEMTGFFVLHGVCVVAEMGVKRAVSGRWRLPWVVSWPLTVGFVVATSFWLFFPPLTRSGADVKVIGEFKCFGDFATRNLFLVVGKIIS
ncbi:hypothetical protein U1Q18_024033 [Sarracenia purpurea var. burkii]